MKRAFISMGVLALLFIGIPVSQAAGASQTYCLSVHIPAIAGVNVPLDDPRAEIHPPIQPQQLQTDVRHVVRNGTEIVLQTILAK